jgi:hypothetical protein
VADAPADRAAPRPSAINTVGASAVVETVGIVLVWWAVGARSPGWILAGTAVLVVAAAGIGVGLGVGTVLAAIAIGLLVAQARSVGVGGPHVALDAGVEAAWAVDDEVLGVAYESLATVTAGGEVQRAGETAVGRHTLVVAGGVATVDREEVVVRGADGALVWRAPITVDGREPGVIDVAAVDADGRVAVLACVDPLDGRCELVGLGADGAETWRRPADTAVPGVGPVVIDDEGGIDLAEAPTRLVVVDDPGAPDARLVEVDLATGAETDLGAAGEAAVVGAVVTVARVGPDGCEVAILRDGTGDDEEVVDVPCAGDRVGTPAPLGSVVVHRQRGAMVAVDVETGEAGSVEVGSDHRVVLAGAGLVAEQDPATVVVHDVLTGEAVASYDGWDLVSGGPDGLVLQRDRESGNPFAPEEVREVAVVDPDTGEICTRARLDVEYVDHASPLPGCRAIVSSATDGSTLVG